MTNPFDEYMDRLDKTKAKRTDRNTLVNVSFTICNTDLFPNRIDAVTDKLEALAREYPILYKDLKIRKTTKTIALEHYSFRNKSNNEPYIAPR